MWDHVFHYINTLTQTRVIAGGFTRGRQRQAAQRAAPEGCLHERRHHCLKFKLALTSAHPAAQCRCEPTPHALFFQAAQAQCTIRTAILFTPVKFPLPMFRSRVNLVERQFPLRSHWLPVTWCWRNSACKIAGSSEADAQLTAILSGFKRQPGCCRSCKLHLREWPTKSHIQKFLSLSKI